MMADTPTNIRRWNQLTNKRRSVAHSIGQSFRQSVIHRMSEGRKTQIVLLDDRRLDITVQPKLSAGELLDLVSSHFNLKEKEYFGLSYRDESGHQHWLQLDRSVLDHEFLKKSGILVLYFSVRFFIESISYLRDSATVELFYLQAKQAMAKGYIECDSETAFELAAFAMQATCGDFVHTDYARKQLKKLPLIPPSCLKQHPSIVYCEDQILDLYEALVGWSRGAAIVKYMETMEGLATYGIHYYEVRDKVTLPWWLGISHRGIAQYDHSDKKVPRKMFPWKQLENLYFRDKKFSIEVHDPKRVSVSRRTFGAGNVNVHAWFTSSSQLTKCIWSMAVSQHQFYLDRKQRKCLPSNMRSLNDIADDLSHSMSSLPSNASDLSRSNSSHSMSLSTGKTIVEDNEVLTTQQKEVYETLKKSRQLLMERLADKMELLKKICLQEAELTGKLPPEYPTVDGEVLPNVRRKVGTTFTLSPKTMRHQQQEEQISELEVEFEIQQNKTQAAFHLASDTKLSKSVRKSHKSAYQKSYKRLKDLEKKLNAERKSLGKTPIQAQSLQDITGVDSNDEEEGNGVEAPEGDSSNTLSPKSSPHSSRNNLVTQDTKENNQIQDVNSVTPWYDTPADPPPPTYQQQQQHQRYQQLQHQYQQSPTYNQSSASLGTPASYAHNSNPLGAGSQSTGHLPYSPHTPYTSGYGSSSSSVEDGVGDHMMPTGYTPNPLYRTRTHYRTLTYPTLSSQQNPSDYSHHNPYDGDGNLNLYNVDKASAIHYESGDELEKPDTPTDGTQETTAWEASDGVPPPGQYYRDDRYNGGGDITPQSTYSNDLQLTPVQGGPSQAPYQYHQQAPPRTPQFEAPPMSYTQQDFLPLTMESSGQGSITVTRKPNHVEYCKSYTSDDYHKYSTKQKNRSTEQTVNKLEEVLTGRRGPSSPHTPSDTAHTPTQWTPSPPQHPVYSIPNAASPHTASLTHFSPNHYVVPTPNSNNTAATYHHPGGNHSNLPPNPTITSYRAPQPQMCEPVTSSSSLHSERSTQLLSWYDSSNTPSPTHPHHQAHTPGSVSHSRYEASSHRQGYHTTQTPHGAMRGYDTASTPHRTIHGYDAPHTPHATPHGYDAPHTPHATPHGYYNRNLPSRHQGSGGGGVHESDSILEASYMSSSNTAHNPTLV